MFTRDTPYLTIDTFLDVVKKEMPSLYLGWYVFSVVSGNRYLPRGSNGNALCITTTGIVFIARYVIPLAPILFLDYRMIQQIQRNSFKKNFIFCRKTFCSGYSPWLYFMPELVLMNTVQVYCQSLNTFAERNKNAFQ